jgi:CRISPR type III-B/RAMP module-associated protein Cmr5
MTTQTLTTRELDRARHVHQQLARIRSNSDLKEYSDRLKGAPAECMDNGLLQTLAFYAHKGGAHRSVGQHVMDWLRHRRLVGDGGDSLEKLALLDAVAYRRCTEEAIAWLNLAKRLAAARVASQDIP